MDPWGQPLPARASQGGPAVLDTTSPWAGNCGDTISRSTKGGYADSWHSLGSPAQKLGWRGSSTTGSAKGIQHKIHKLVDLGLSWAMAPVPVKHGEDKLNFVDPAAVSPPVGPTNASALWTEDVSNKGTVKKSKRNEKKSGKLKNPSSCPDQGLDAGIDAPVAPVGSKLRGEKAATERKSVTFNDNDEKFTPQVTPSPEDAAEPSSAHQGQPENAGEPRSFSPTCTCQEFLSTGECRHVPGASSQPSAPENQNTAGSPLGFGNTPGGKGDGKSEKKRRRWRFPVCCGGGAGRGQLPDDSD